MIIIAPNRAPKKMAPTTTQSKKRPNSGGSKVVDFPGDTKFHKSVMDVETEIMGISPDALGVLDLDYINAKELQELTAEAFDLLGAKGFAWAKKHAIHMLDVVDPAAIKDPDTALVLYHVLTYLNHLFNVHDPDDTQTLLEVEAHISVHFQDYLQKCPSVNAHIFGDGSYSDHAVTKLLAFPLACASLIADERETAYIEESNSPGSFTNHNVPSGLPHGWQTDHEDWDTGVYY